MGHIILGAQTVHLFIHNKDKPKFAVTGFARFHSPDGTGHHSGNASLHVAGTPAIQTTVLLCQMKGIAHLPVSTRGNDVQMAGKDNPVIRASIDSHDVRAVFRNILELGTEAIALQHPRNILGQGLLIPVDSWEGHHIPQKLLR